MGSETRAYSSITVVSLKILAGLISVLDNKGEYGSMLRDTSTYWGILTAPLETG